MDLDQPNKPNGRYKTMRLKFQDIEMISELMAPRKFGLGPKKLEIAKKLREHADEKWADDSVHQYYKVPILAVNANPSILMHCVVQRDNIPCPALVSVNRWVSTEYFIWEMSAGLADSGRNPIWTRFFERHHQVEWQRIQAQFETIADLADRFVLEIAVPPFLVAEVRIQTEDGERYFCLCSQSGRDMIDSPFWDLWMFILRQDTDSVELFDVTLRTPTITVPGEFDPSFSSR